MHWRAEVFAVERDGSMQRTDLNMRPGRLDHEVTVPASTFI